MMRSNIEYHSSNMLDVLLLAFLILNKLLLNIRKIFTFDILDILSLLICLPIFKNK